jgi:hypothetical protein
MNLIFAGTHRQASQFAEKKGWPPRDWRYVHDWTSLTGYNKATLYCLGTYYNRKQLSEVITSARRYNLNIIRYNDYQRTSQGSHRQSSSYVRSPDADRNFNAG